MKNNLATFLFTSSMLICIPAGIIHAAEADNMVMIPMDMPPSPLRQMPTAHVTPHYMEENMVRLPDAASSKKEDPFTPVTGPNYVEAGINIHNVSNNQGDWFGQFVNAQLQTDAQNRWNVQLQHQESFHDQGSFIGVGNTHTFNELWFSDVGVGFGTDAGFLPLYRVDAAINRRLLEAGNLVGTLGTTISKAHETYTSHGAFMGASWYFAPFWVAQAGMRVDVSDPGSVAATSGFGALTYGQQKHYYLTGRYGYGREAYQLLGNGNITSAFNSHNAGLSWRQWLAEDWGFNLSGEYYTNPTYHRTGTIVSVFKEF